MNPLASTKCAGRLLVAFAAISSILFAAGCGGSSTTVVPPPGGSFSNSSLNGTYVISISGTDANVSQNTSSFFAIVGTITADGGGNITGGTVDINDPNIGGVFTGQALSTSTYSIGKDGRGTGSLKTAEGTFGLDFVLTTTSHGLITRFDSSGSGSGTIDAQGSATQASLSALAFSLTGTDATSQFAVGSVGGFTLDGSGTITAGTQDFNENGSSANLTDLALTGSVVLNSGSTTAGTATLTTGSAFGSLGFDFWVVDSTHLKLIETDSGAVLAGDAFTQQTSIPAGTLAYTLGGFDSGGGPFVAGGLLSVSGTTLTGIEDFNDAGNTGSEPNVTGPCVLTAGRCALSLSGFSNGSLNNFIFAAYPSSGGIQLLEIDSLGLTQGAAYTQSATSFAASEGYGFNLSGTNGNEVDDIAQFNALGATVSPNMTGILDENDLTAPLNPVTLSGTYTPDSPVDGRGSISVPNINTSIGTLNLEYYVVDGSTVVFVEGDSNQVALGTFELQSPPTQGAAAVQSHMSMMRPVARSHAALRRK
ncbi:MAG: hypothetical protein WCA97_08900 [Terriglobales bacterium]